jgi:hypothetical protein
MSFIAIAYKRSAYEVLEFTIDEETAKASNGDVEAHAKGWEKAGGVRFQATEKFHRVINLKAGSAIYYG